MNNEQFLDAIDQMNGLTVAMTNRLRTLAPQLEDHEREEALTALEPLNKQLVEALEAQILCAENKEHEATRLLHSANRQEEDRTRIDDMAQIDTKLNAC